jgi:hypothetical protein
MTEPNDPNEPAADEPDAIPPSEMPAIADALRKARLIPWDTVDLECPSASLQSVGAAVEDAACQLRCECGTVFRLELDGETRQRCPKCKTIFRHCLIVQAEDRTPSATAATMAAILEAQGD